MTEVVFYFLGQEYRFRTDLPEEVAQEVVSYLYQKIEELELERRPLPPVKVAVLLLLNIARDYVTLKDEVARETRRLIEQIDQELTEGSPCGVRD